MLNLLSRRTFAIMSKRYTTTHEWIQLLSKKTARIGLTNYAQAKLGQIVHIEQPKLRKFYRRGEAVVEIESVKATAQLFAPVNLEIVNSNNSVINNPNIVSIAAETDGWIVEAEIESERDLESLLDEKSYMFLIEQQNKE